MKEKILVISNTSFSIKKFREHYLKKFLEYKIYCLTPQKINSKFFNSIRLGKNNILFDIIKIYLNLIKYKFNKIIVYSFKYQLIFSIILLFYKQKNVYFIIAGKGSIFLKKNLLSTIAIFLFRLIFNNKKNYIFINKKDQLFFKRKFNLKNSSLLPTEGVEIIPYKKKKNLKKNFIFFARLIKPKGLREYIEAAKKLKLIYPKLNFYIAGPSSINLVGQSSFLLDNEDIFFILKNKKYLNYLGYIRDYKQIFPKMDCLISPSYTEGAGNSVLEAMMSGLFVIASKNNGHNYILSETNNFFLNEITAKDIINNVENFLKLNHHFLNKNFHKSYNKVKNNFSSQIVYENLKNILNKNQVN